MGAVVLQPGKRVQGGRRALDELPLPADVQRTSRCNSHRQSSRFRYDSPMRVRTRCCVDLRDKMYAHTDKDTGRTAGLGVESATGLGNLDGLPVSIGFMRNEEWLPFPREALPDALRLFDQQRERFHTEAAKIHLMLRHEGSR